MTCVVESVQVEYSYPPLVSGGEGCEAECPPGWKYLPTLALPDGSHNFDEDTVFFHLPSLTDPNQTVFGISCFRQIPVEVSSKSLPSNTKQIPSHRTRHLERPHSPTLYTTNIINLPTPNMTKNGTTILLHIFYLLYYKYAHITTKVVYNKYTCIAHIKQNNHLQNNIIQ